MSEVSGIVDVQHYDKANVRAQLTVLSFSQVTLPCCCVLRSSLWPLQREGFEGVVQTTASVSFRRAEVTAKILNSGCGKGQRLYAVTQNGKITFGSSAIERSCVVLVLRSRSLRPPGIRFRFRNPDDTAQQISVYVNSTCKQYHLAERSICSCVREI